MLTTNQLAKVLQTSYRSAYRISSALQLVKSIHNHKLFHHIDKKHPLHISLDLVDGAAKPLYTISEIARLWKWRKGFYTARRVRQLLFHYDVPIYNKEKKGYVYLSDLQKLLKQ
jgi:hypothetical protein